jgi:uncharacterized SAM-binding protein YcdF (DUF218 family)
MASGDGGRRRRAWTGLAAGALAGFIAVDLGLPGLVSYWGDWTYVVVASAVIGTAIWLTPLRRLGVLAVGLLGALWLAVAFTPLTAGMADGLVRRDPLQAADAVFVFGSSVQPDGDPTPASMARLFRGVELVAEGRASRLVVSDIPPPSGDLAPLARAWVARFAPGAEVLVVGHIYNTHDEAVALKALFEERGWSRVLAVTSPTHTRRAAAALEAQGLEVVAVPAVEIEFDLEDLALPADRRAAFGTLAHEWLGLYIYRRRGWID